MAERIAVFERAIGEVSKPPCHCAQVERTGQVADCNGQGEPPSRHPQCSSDRLVGIDLALRQNSGRKHLRKRYLAVEDQREKRGFGSRAVDRVNGIAWQNRWNHYAQGALN